MACFLGGSCFGIPNFQIVSCSDTTLQNGPLPCISRITSSTYVGLFVPPQLPIYFRSFIGLSYISGADLGRYHQGVTPHPVTKTPHFQSLPLRNSQLLQNARLTELTPLVRSLPQPGAKHWGPETLDDPLHSIWDPIASTKYYCSNFLWVLDPLSQNM